MERYTAKLPNLLKQIVCLLKILQSISKWIHTHYKESQRNKNKHLHFFFNRCFSEMFRKYKVPKTFYLSKVWRSRIIKIGILPIEKQKILTTYSDYLMQLNCYILLIARDKNKHSLHKLIHKQLNDHRHITTVTKSLYI